MIAKTPPGDRACQGLVALFAIWTLCSHAGVSVGAGLRQLLGLATIAFTLCAVVWWRSHRGGATNHAAPGVVPESPIVADDRSRQLARAVGFALGVAAVLGGLFAKDVVALWWSISLVLTGAAVIFVLAERPQTPISREGRALEWGLFALAAFCVCVVLIAHRPDGDDSFYINVAVAAADAPTRPLLDRDTLHGIDGLPLHQPIYRLHSFELLAGAVSYVTGIPAIYCFHFLFAAVGAFFLPLATASLLRRLVPRHWLWTTVAFVFLLIAIGETHRWYGNFALVRMWQGKSVYLFVFMPLVYAAALDFAKRPDASRWLRLAAAQIAAVGCSSSAVWAGPAGALMAMCCVLRPNKDGLRTFVWGASASIYVLAAGWWLMQGNIEVHDPLLQRARVRAAARPHQTGRELAEALATVFGTARLHSVALIVLASSWALQARGLARRFAIVLPLAVWLVLLNPYLERLVTGTLTGPSFWRVVWCIPLPLLLALALTSPFGLHVRFPVKLSASIAALGLFAAFVPSYSALSPENRPVEVPGFLRLGVPSLKVPVSAYRSAYDWAAELNDSVPVGASVVAPEYISLWIPTFHHSAHPLLVRESYLRKHLDRLGRDEVRPRRVMTRYVAGIVMQTDAPEVFRAGLDRFDVKAVCLAVTHRSPDIRATLRELGFERTVAGPEHEIWVRG